jgi:hypothetical protein
MVGAQFGGAGPGAERSDHRADRDQGRDRTAEQAGARRPHAAIAGRAATPTAGGPGVITGWTSPDRPAQRLRAFGSSGAKHTHPR